MPEARFLDVGAVVFYAKAVPWECPDFSVDNNFRQLCALQKNCAKHGYIASREHRFIIAARNIK